MIYKKATDSATAKKPSKQRTERAQKIGKNIGVKDRKSSASQGHKKNGDKLGPFLTGKKKV